MTDGKIGVGIIGYGGIAGHHAKVIDNIPSARLVAVADVVQERLDAAKEQYGADGYLDYRDLLARDDIVAVDICTPSGLHGQVGIDAASAGKHIMSEKPIDVNLARADDMIAAAKKNRVKLSVIFQNRFDAAAQEIKRMLDGKRLGDIFLADAYVKWYRTQEYYEEGSKWRGTLALDGGGAIINQSVHYVDLLQWFIGPVASVYGYKATVAHQIEGEDVAVGVVRFRNGAMGVIEGSTACHPGFGARIEIHGTKGCVTWAGGKVENLKIIGEEKPPEAQEGATEAKPQTDPLAISLGPHLIQLERFFEAIREDKEPDVTGQEARKSLEIVTALYRSADTGEVVRLPLAG